MNHRSGLRIGLVGCGYQGSIFARTIAESNAMQVTACADPDQAAAERVASLSRNAAVYRSVEDMLNGTQVDAVIKATSHAALYPCALAAIKAEKPVLVEKPVGLNESEVVELEETTAKYGICFMSGYSFRYIAAWQKVYELLQAGSVGEIHTISARIGVGPMSKGWKASPETGGGPMLYVGSHLLDQILWYLADDPVEVCADIRRRADTHTDETTTFQIKFTRGTIAQGIVTQTSISGLYHTLDIYGRQGRLSLQGYGFTYEITVESSAISAYSNPTRIAIPQVDDLRILMHEPQLAEFSKAIQEQRQPSCTVGDGRKVLKLIDALFQSDHIGKPVQII